MPTYEFRCRTGHTFSRFYKTMSAAPGQLSCPECDAPAERQLSGGAGLLFKGSGFYLTDYGKNAHRKPESADGAKAASEKAGEGGKTAVGDAAAAGGAGGVAGTGSGGGAKETKPATESAPASAAGSGGGKHSSSSRPPKPRSE